MIQGQMQTFGGVTTDDDVKPEPIHVKVKIWSLLQY